MKRVYLFLLIPICFFLMSLNEIPQPKTQALDPSKEAGIDLCMTIGNPKHIVSRFHVGPTIAAILIALVYGGEHALRYLRRKKTPDHPKSP